MKFTMIRFTPWAMAALIALSMFLPFYNVVQSPMCDGFQGVSIQFERYLYFKKAFRGISNETALFFTDLFPFVWPTLILILSLSEWGKRSARILGATTLILGISTLYLWAAPMIASYWSPNMDPQCPNGRWYPLYGWFTAVLSLVAFLVARAKEMKQPNQAL